MVTPEAVDPPPERRCAHCGSASLAHRRSDARYCSAPCRAAASRANAARTPQTFAEDLDQAHRTRSARRRTQAPQTPNDHPRLHDRSGAEAFIAAVIAAFDAKDVKSDEIRDDAVVVRIDAGGWPA